VIALRRPGRRPADDDGAILVIVLIVVTVIALIVAAVASQTEVSIRRTTVVRSHLAKVYAADAGIEHAIQSLKRDNTICPDPAHEYDFPDQTFNGRTVSIHCKTLSGSANGLLGYAVVVLDPVDSLTTQGAVGTSKQIDGPVYAVRFPSSVDVSVTLGDVTEQTGRCLTDADIPSSMSVATGFAFRCVPVEPAPSPEHALPASIPAVAPLPDTTAVPGCKIFKPGTYTLATKPVLAADNYFASGVYYFAGIGTLSVTTQHVVGGQPATDETVLNAGGGACATDAQAGVTGTTTGVKFILGGNSSILTDDPSGSVELFTRDGGNVADEGTQGVSLQTVPTGTALPWLASTLGAGDAVLRVGNGNNPALSIHGMVYVPNALVDFSATNSSEAQLRGGVVAARLKLQSSASASGLAVSVNVGRGRRHIVLTSTAKGVTDGGRDVIATAVLDIVSNATRDVSIESWNTT